MHRLVQQLLEPILKTESKILRTPRRALSERFAIEILPPSPVDIFALVSHPCRFQRSVRTPPIMRHDRV